MQSKKSNNLDFSRRTDVLAATIGCDLVELPKVLGFSRASLFAYRSGKAKITQKAWQRLLMAERDRAIRTPTGSLTRGSKMPSESTGLLAAELARRESDPEAWGDAFEIAVTVAGIRLFDLLETTRDLVNQATLAAESLQNHDPSLAANIREVIERVNMSLKRGDRVHNDFFHALTILVDLVPEWLDAMLKKRSDQKVSTEDPRITSKPVRP